jgi:hypothetical protein
MNDNYWQKQISLLFYKLECCDKRNGENRFAFVIGNIDIVFIPEAKNVMGLILKKTFCNPFDNIDVIFQIKRGVEWGGGG